VVATWLAVEGLDVRDGREVALAKTDEDFSRQIMSLLAARNHRPSPASPRWTSGSRPANFYGPTVFSALIPLVRPDLHDRRSCAADAVSRPQS
jgi:hypothetical protein